MNTFTDSQLFEIGRGQKKILCLILVSIPIVIGLPFVPATRFSVMLIGVLFILIGCIGAVLIYRLATALDEPWPWLYVVCAFIPYVNTATLLIVNVKATAALKARGIRVGLMGADRSELNRLQG